MLFLSFSVILYGYNHLLIQGKSIIPASWRLRLGRVHGLIAGRDLEPGPVFPPWDDAKTLQIMGFQQQTSTGDRWIS